MPRKLWTTVLRLTLAILGAAVGIVFAWCAHYGAIAGLASHLASAPQVAGGYSSAMSLVFNRWQVAALSFILFFLFLALWAAYQRHTRAILSLTGCIMPFFVAWKHSVVRQDVHVRVLVLFGLFAVTILAVDSLRAARRWRALPLLVLATSALLLPWFYPPPVGDADPMKSFQEKVMFPLTPPGAWGFEKLVHFPAYRAATARQSREGLRSVVLPDELRMFIGRSPIDIYPWESSYVAANDLVWQNRPSPASFGSYTPSLDRRNAAFFESPRKPPYLLWHLEPAINSIDGRHLFWDEPLTLVSILNHYELIRNRDAFLLASRSSPRFVSRERLETREVPWQTWIRVPENRGVILAEIILRRPWVVRLRRLVLREEPMFLSVRFSSGEETEYRFVPDQVASGLWISPLPRDTREMRAVLRGRLRRVGKVVAIKFHGGWGRESAPPLRITWMRLS